MASVHLGIAGDEGAAGPGEFGDGRVIYAMVFALGPRAHGENCTDRHQFSPITRLIATVPWTELWSGQLAESSSWRRGRAKRGHWGLRRGLRSRPDHK